MIFIELTSPNYGKFYAQIAHIKRVYQDKDGWTHIVGLNNNGSIAVKEEIHDVMVKIKDAVKYEKIN